MSTDPRLRLAARRQLPGGPLAAAVRLEVAADAMRTTVRQGPEPAPEAEEAPLTAAEFAALVDPDPDPAPEPLPPAPAPPAFESYDPGPRAGDPIERGEALTVPPAGLPGLNWRSRHDERSRSYAVRRTLAGSVPLQPVLMSTGPALDQGAEGACIGFGCIDAANTLALIRTPGAAGDQLLDAGDALELYRLAQKIDEYPGEAYSGTSVLAGMQAGQQQGLWGGYLWCFGTRDIAQTLLRRRPVVIGIPWYDGMYSTGPRGVVQVSGDHVGGHCLVVVGLTMTGPNGEPGVHFVWQNSWGPTYGDEGLGYIAHRTLATLLHSHGEAATPTPTVQVPA